MILLVEDEAGIREALCAFLRLQGHEVHGACSVESARQALTCTLPRYLITDIDLGDGDGRDLVDQLREVAPDSLCLVLTARSAESIADWIGSRDGITVLQKPVRPARLLAWLESCSASPDDFRGCDSAMAELDVEESRAIQTLLARLVQPAPIPQVQRSWREGERIRLRLAAPPSAFRLRDLDDHLRRRLLELDLDLWPGGEECTELGLKSEPLTRLKSEEVAAFDSTRVGPPLEKVHEDEAWDENAPGSIQQPAICDAVSGSVPGLPDGQLGRVDEERRLLWPDADLPGADARCEAVKEQ